MGFGLRWVLLGVLVCFLVFDLVFRFSGDSAEEKMTDLVLRVLVFSFVSFEAGLDDSL